MKSAQDRTRRPVASKPARRPHLATASSVMLRHAGLRLTAIAVAIVATVAIGVAGCGSEEQAEAPSSTSARGGSQFAAAAADAVKSVGAGEATLLDVRTDSEFAGGHAPEAEHIPLASIESGARPEGAKQQTIFVYCASGRRAAIAVRILRNDGYTSVTNIGGLDDWRRAGGEVSSEEIP